MKLYNFSALVLLCLTSLSHASATTCFESTLCFEMVHTQWGGVTMDVGIVLPPVDSTPFRNEFIANFTIPDTYGWAGMGPPGFNVTGRGTSVALGILISADEPIDPSVELPLSDAFLQVSNALPNNTLTWVDENNDGKMTLFPQSHIGPEVVSYTLRCRNCTSLFVSGEDKVTIELFFSPSPPEYMDANRTIAMLPLDGVSVVSVNFDADAARVDNATYASFLAVGGLEA